MSKESSEFKRRKKYPKRLLKTSGSCPNKAIQSRSASAVGICIAVAALIGKSQKAFFCLTSTSLQLRKNLPYIKSEFCMNFSIESL
jgi:hypothetical protein